MSRLRELSPMNVRNLSIRTSSSKQLQQHRRYLGDPSDPHYVPKSPLIERRKISTQDEADLKHMCSLALADIPHSDDMMDDPFRYLGGHIAVKTSTKPPGGQVQTTKHQSVPAKPPKALEDQVPSGASSATPSENSKRDTVQTNVTTPMTTPGITPGDTDKRFSEGGKRPSVTAPSTTKIGTDNSKGNHIFSFLRDPHPSTKPQLTATKSLTHLPTLSRAKSKQKSSDRPVQNSRSVTTNPDFNKSLPSIPKFSSHGRQQAIDSEPDAKDKSNGTSQGFKIARLTRTQTAGELDHLHKFQSVPPPKKQKFSFSSIFHRRPTVNNKRATVG